MHERSFQIVRIPVYTAVITMVIGLALTVPNLIALAGVVAVISGSELQIRLIEEPWCTSSYAIVTQTHATDVSAGARKVSCPTVVTCQRRDPADSSAL